jgi:hypothetical protein
MTRPHLILVTLFSALTLAGCGSNGTPEAEPSTNAADMGVKFAQCMREHGVDMEDPVDGKIMIKTTKGNQAKTEAAQQACKQFAPQREGNANDPEARDRELKMAACLRKNGVDVKDPQPGQGIRITGGPGDAGKLEKAQKACDKELGDNVSGG